MEVFAITIFMSLAFAVLYAVLCYAERSQRLRQPNEQVALLPLEEAGPVQPARVQASLSHPAPQP
jgi:hypothetical protein